MNECDELSQLNQVPELFSRGLLSAPLALCCLADAKDFGHLAAQHKLKRDKTLNVQPGKVDQVVLDAQLLADGTVSFLGVQYPDLEAARLFARPHPRSTSTAWQFWLYFDERRGAWAPLEHMRAALAHDVVLAQQSELKDSKSHPLRIDAVSYPGSCGQIGMTICPGKRAKGLYGGTWVRDLQTDLTTIALWHPLALISLMETPEFELLDVAHFPDAVLAQTYQWLSVPIPDMSVPTPEFERQWLGLSPGLHSALRDGGRIVLHCRGGLGRTGVVAARLLIEAGVQPASAVSQVRQARMGAIETYAQEFYLLTRAWAG